MAFETELGPINQSGVDCISKIGRRLAQASGDARERYFLFQRRSITVKRFDSVAFKDSFFLDTHQSSTLFLILVFSPRAL